jgi:uncharacterized protein (DUF2141 family)
VSIPNNGKTMNNQTIRPITPHTRPQSPRSLTVLLGQGCVLLALAASVLPAQAADITVDIQPLPSSEGWVMVSLFERSADYPHNIRYGQRIAASRQVAGQPLQLVFTQLQPGRYALLAYQDKDGNGKLNTNLMGIPNEPVGFSNNAKASFGQPSFDSAAFEVGPQGARVNLTLQ